MAETVETVLGPVSPESLGRTLTHEHFALDFNKFYTPPPNHLADKFIDDITLGNVGYLKQYPYSSKYNLTFYDQQTLNAVCSDIKNYKKHGGGAIVENTSIGLNRNLGFMKEVSLNTGVHVVAGTGYYVSAVQTQSTLEMTKENMYDQILSDLTTGESGVKCGFIGEVGSSWPIDDFEKRSIEATALAQESMHCAVSFHPGRNREAPFEIMRIFMEAGGNAHKTIMSHLDRTLLNTEDLLQFSDLGCYCQFDLFGTECSFYQLAPMCDMPSDAQRVDKILKLIEHGKTDKILMSHDVHTKHRLEDFGGHGYSHIMNNVYPKMLIKGISQEIIDQITITNPHTWLKK